ncbi:MAG TPA: c-type cytochrome [Stellaceae bacterium]|nr:c-type cytochrome [Stellaceae bacterium]
MSRPFPRPLPTLLTLVLPVLWPWTILGTARAAQPDPQHGAVLFQARCAICHLPDKVKVGPPLGGVFGRKAGSVPGYAYSPALRNSKLTWTRPNLERWLANPGETVPGNKMGISVPDPASRADIIAYLATLKAPPAPGN